MRAESVRVSFGCLLHDIGKPVLRAGGQAGDHSSLGYPYFTESVSRKFIHPILQK